MKKYILVAAMMLIAAMPAHAEWSKPFSIEYAMGDGDNRASARQSAIEQIKLKASAAAGTYIQSTTTMHESGALTENVQMLSASLIKVSRVEDKLTVNSAGQAALKVTAMVSLDDAELARRVKIMQEDKGRAEQVKQLQSENDELRKVLVQIRVDLKSKSGQSNAAALLAKQDMTIQRLDENGRTISKVFERGTLLQLANHNSDGFDKAKADIEENLIAPILREHIFAEIESVEKTDGKYVALVRVGWNLNLKSYNKVLSKYFKLYASDDNLEISGYSNTKGEGPSVFSEKLFNYLPTKAIDVRLAIGEKEVVVPVLFNDGGSWTACDSQSSKPQPGNGRICLVTQSKNKPQIRGQASLNNPIRIELTASEAEQATHVDASFEMHSSELERMDRVAEAAAQKLRIERVRSQREDQFRYGYSR